MIRLRICRIKQTYFAIGLFINRFAETPLPPTLPTIHLCNMPPAPFLKLDLVLCPVRDVIHLVCLRVFLTTAVEVLVIDQIPTQLNTWITTVRF